ncbi:RHH-type proline utilization regulon transcriptional repressor/proline dehydrogenase/delta 1-pyrroline-5-carboxylate dehydrogenase [Paucibacter oligotrophus]|uniref:Bifunctional protein PutA n=1 Tax=Roseateles oligotrophus TaxID=1769250 RepID=A0A840LHC1_9BURK|nr:RHH-type proline utilization regulon transcriptional repressor/proline dehydrogenase/delta 1-pyrroline-5-carboxylate dehydrogenase [Roseateles oligotrophus]
MSTFALLPEAARLPSPYRDEQAVVNALVQSLGERLDWPAVIQLAGPWVQQVRANPAPFWAMESLLREYPITSSEGLALMRLAEALLRVPDAPTAIALTADQLGRGQFDGGSEGPHKMLASLSASAISLSKKFLPDAEGQGGLMTRLGAQTVVAATVRAIQLLGRQFVLGRNIQEAMGEAADARKVQPMLRFSYDMLGEGARTELDAERYQAAYVGAIKAIAAQAKADSPEGADGISIKLSALFSRYEVLQRERVFAELLPRVWQLIELAASANINLTIDAEEVDRLELSLDVLDALAARIAGSYPQWRGFGLAVQAYQTRALPVIHEVAAIAKKHGLRFMVRLVKGAYWDGEIKRAQELGLNAYPVFTHKQHTDVSYLACAQALIEHADVIYPQFASHNAGTIAAIVQMARKAGAKFEMQRLHGMGEGVYREVLKDGTIPCRVYAPVGEHRDLLAYLVRRLLENGANSSFVHQLADVNVQVPELLGSPLAQVQAQGALPLPPALYLDRLGFGRRNSSGADLTDIAQRQPLLQALDEVRLDAVAEARPEAVEAAMARLQAGFGGWNSRPVAERAAILRRAADALDARLPEFCALLVKEAFKTQGDCVAEVREAVDFLRYYADQAESDAPRMQGRGVFVCISPWNFPLAIFAGQVVAALVAGNTVAAKPAEQTPFVAQQFVELLIEAGLPRDALVLLHGAGETVGAGLVADARTAGVCFTGSTQVAQIINRKLAAKDGPVVPLIAETGGLNAMVVDSTALPEQVVDAVVQSAFRSAGQRCSALRLLCVHESIAEGVIEMLRGALQELWVGQPAELATDVGPVIDEEAFDNIQQNVARLKREAKLIAESKVHEPMPRLVQPVAFEIPRIDVLRQEIFGPVLHVLRWGGDVDAVLEQINALGYGLTLGIQTRIDSRALRLADKARIGNVYVNRNVIGAVVGVQPFGGEGMSGTGPKAGGPNYLYRFCALPDAAPALGQAGLSAPASPAPAASFDLAGLQAAQQAWGNTALSERVALLRRAFDGHASSAQLSARLSLSQLRLSEQSLPGPTGESNELRLHGRGVLALLAQGASEEALALALCATLASGNSLALLAQGPALTLAQTLQQRLRQAGLPMGLLQIQQGGREALAGLLADERLAGVVLAAQDVATERELWRQMAAEQGAIRPLISAAEVAQASQQYRFSAEQTLTINTAAAGGNAALLAGMH